MSASEVLAVCELRICLKQVEATDYNPSDRAKNRFPRS
jgi:hypothetical protein